MDTAQDTATRNWEALRDADLSTDINHLDVRRNVLRPALMQRDTSLAIEVLERLVTAAPGRNQELGELASLYVKTGQPDLAAGTIAQARDNNPEDAGLAAQAIQIMLSARQPKAAAAVALESEALWGKNGRLADLAARALSRAGDNASALQAARISMDLNSDDPGALAKAAAVLNAAGLASEAKGALHAMEEFSESTPESDFELGRACYLLDSQSEEALMRLERAYLSAPTSKRYADLYSRVLLDQGRAAHALEVVEASGSMTTGIAGRMHYARCLKGVRRYDEAAVEMEKVLAADPTSVATRRYTAGMMALAGRVEDAHAVYQDGLKLRGNALPDTLVAGLSGISGRLDEANIPQARLDWAWKQVKAMGNAPASREIWERSVRWINLADYLILDWIECRPERGQELVDLIDGIDAGRDALNAALEQGKGVLLAGGHIGALFAAPAAVVSTGVQASWVASTPDFGEVGGRDPKLGEIISTTASDASSLARRIVRGLGAGRVISIAIDGSGVPGMPRYPLFDRMISLSDFIPRVVFKTGGPSFFSILEWKQGRIQARLVPMPVPAEGEDEDAFIRRWMAAYTGEIEEMFRSHPENLRMSGGFWGSISS